MERYDHESDQTMNTSHSSSSSLSSLTCTDSSSEEQNTSHRPDKRIRNELSSSSDEPGDINERGQWIDKGDDEDLNSPVCKASSSINHTAGDVTGSVISHVHLEVSSSSSSQSDFSCSRGSSCSMISECSSNCKRTSQTSAPQQSCNPSQMRELPTIIDNEEFCHDSYKPSLAIEPEVSKSPFPATQFTVEPQKPLALAVAPSEFLENLISTHKPKKPFKYSKWRRVIVGDETKYINIFKNPNYAIMTRKHLQRRVPIHDCNRECMHDWTDRDVESLPKGLNPFMLPYLAGFTRIFMKYPPPQAGEDEDEDEDEDEEGDDEEVTEGNEMEETEETDVDDEQEVNEKDGLDDQDKVNPNSKTKVKNKINEHVEGDQESDDADSEQNDEEDEEDDEENEEEEEEEEDDEPLPLPQNIAYVTPCGKILSMMEHVRQYLLETEATCHLSLDTFTFSLHFTTKQMTEKAREYVADVSGGKEPVPVSMINTTDEIVWVSNSPVGEFRYITERKFHQELDISESYVKEFISCCTCEDNCESDTCECKMLTAQENCGRGNGYKYRRLEKWLKFGIFECNDGCPCNPACPNRLVQFGVRNKIQIFRMKRKGWGLRTMHFIPKGQFICTYSGRIIDPASLSRAASRTIRQDYLADLDYIEIGIKASKKKKNLSRAELFPDHQHMFAVDGTVESNLGRCFNHSCDPNLFVQSVFIETHDMRFNHLAFFALRDIFPFEEICWNYNYRMGADCGRVIYCQCCSLKCASRLL